MQEFDVRAISLKLLREPALRQALERLSRGSHVVPDPAAQGSVAQSSVAQGSAAQGSAAPDSATQDAAASEFVATLVAGGLCTTEEGRPQLTRLGRSVSYHLSEHRIQIEQGAADRFVSRLDVRQDSRVLDIGCGAGQSLVALTRQQPRVAVGIELDPTALAIFAAIRELEQMPRAFSVRGNAEILPFADSSFDRVLCRVVLMHVRVLPALAEIARVSAAGALVYLHLTDFWFYWRKLLKLRLERGGVPFALVNGLLLQTIGRQIRMRATRTMSYQTVGSISRRLERHGFEIVSIEQNRDRRLGPDHRQPKILARRRGTRSTVGASAA